jgi:hypothetical protein
VITPIDVLDTAVKIGLGAVISGAGAYWLAKLNHDRELEKQQAQRRRELLEAVAEQVEKFTHVALKYWAYVNVTARDERLGEEVPQPKYEAVGEVRGELFYMYGEVTSAEAKLLLLGETKCQQLLREYGEAVKSLRSAPYIKNPEFTENYLEHERVEILNKRALFFSELSAVYNRRRI